MDPLVPLQGHPLVRGVVWHGFSTAVDGFVVPLQAKAGYLVIFNDYYRDQAGSRGRRRHRWTVAHELGHIALNHAVRFPRFQTDPTERRLAEIEAHTFAEELLAPTGEMERVSWWSIPELMDYFDLNEEAIVRRLSSYDSYLAQRHGRCG